MATVLRLLCLALGIGCTAVFGFAGSLTVAVQLSATTALIMGGTGHPLVSSRPGAAILDPGGSPLSYPLAEPAEFVQGFVQDALDLFIAPTGSVRADSTDPGLYNLHPNYTVSVTDALKQGSNGDTTYYLLPAARLPLLMPLVRLGVPAPILDVLDAPLRVIVEWGYDRGINPGNPTAATLANPHDPITMVCNLLAAIPIGLDDGLQQAGFGRPLGTTPAGPFGVGGTTLSTAPVPATSPSTPAPATRQPSGRPHGAAGLKPRTRAARDPSRPSAPTADANRGRAGVGGYRARF